MTLTDIIEENSTITKIKLTDSIKTQIKLLQKYEGTITKHDLNLLGGKISQLNNQSLYEEFNQIVKAYEVKLLESRDELNTQLSHIYQKFN